MTTKARRRVSTEPFVVAPARASMMAFEASKLDGFPVVRRYLPAARTELSAIKGYGIISGY